MSMKYTVQAINAQVATISRIKEDLLWELAYLDERAAAEREALLADMLDR